MLGNGNAGIGTAAPLIALHVRNTVTGGGIRVEGTNNITSSIAIYDGSTQIATLAAVLTGGQGLSGSTYGDTVLKNVINKWLIIR